MSSERRLSDAMCLVLQHLRNGYTVYDHCRTRSDYGGLTGTLQALTKRGLIQCDGGDYRLTAAGRAASEESDP